MKNTIESQIKAASQRFSLQTDLCFNSPQLEARMLMEHTTGKSHTWLMTYADTELSEQQLALFNTYVEARLGGKPIAYIIGTQAFWSLNLKVAPCTLIPRQDTELLIEAALELPLPPNAKVLDLGTGTGAIALALASERPQWEICGVDLMDEAVFLAKENAESHGLRATFFQSDWFNKLQHNGKYEKFDFIASNPPYIEDGSEYLNQGDLRFEPKSALSSGVDGLDDIRFIIKHAKLHLNPSAWLIVEHGFAQSDDVQKLFVENAYTHVNTRNDYNDLPRITMGQIT